MVDVCKDCGGVWLENHRVNAVFEHAPLNINSVLGADSLNEAKVLPKHEIRYLACPECQDMMSRYNFMKRSNIILDQCHKHGVWFDKHELAVVLDYLRGQYSSANLVDVVSQTYLKGETTNEATTKSIRSKNERINIQDEDLQLLLQEFPEWGAKQDN